MALPLVQETQFTATGNTAPTIATPVKGNLLVLFVSNQNNFVSTVTNGGTWVFLGHSGSHVPTEIWAAISDGTTTVTIAFAANTGETVGDVAEFNLPTTAAIKDQVATTNGVSSTTIGPTSSITPTTANQLVVAAAGVAAGGLYSTGPSNSFVGLTRKVGAVIAIFPGYLSQGAAAAITTQWTTSVASTWDAVAGSIFTVKIPGPEAAPSLAILAQ